MSVKSVGSHSFSSHTSLCIRELTRARSPMGVTYVENPLSKIPTFTHIRELTQARNPMSVLYVAKVTSRVRASTHIRKSIPVRSPMSVNSVESHLVWNSTSLDTRELTLVRNTTREVCVDEPRSEFTPVSIRELIRVGNSLRGKSWSTTLYCQSSAHQGFSSEKLSVPCVWKSLADVKLVHTSREFIQVTDLYN